MADSSGIVESPSEKKDYVLTLKTPDGTSEVFVHLQTNNDPAQPPSLINVTRQPLSQPASSPSSSKFPDPEIHIIISTGSGHQKASHFFNDVVSPILDALYPAQSITKHTTQSETSILELTQDVFFPAANTGTPLRIIVLSGDGGIVDLVNGFSTLPQSPTYTAPQIALLPLGTANALYHSINPSRKNTWGIPALSSRTTKPLPTYTATFSPGAKLLVNEARATEDLPKNEKGEGVLHGAVVCSWGMHASLVADSDTSAYRKHGASRFAMAAKEALYPADGSLPHAYKGRVSYLAPDNESTWQTLPEQTHMYVLATLVSNLEATFRISPASTPLDGSMHLVHFGPVDGDEAMRIMGLAYDGGRHVGDGTVRYERVGGVRVGFEEGEGRWRRVCVDGRIVMVEEGGWVEVKMGGKGRGVLDVVVGEE